MSGKRQCPRCRAYLCRFNPGPFCWPCTVPGMAWHEPQPGVWVQIPVLRLEQEWEPEPGDMLLSSIFVPLVLDRARGLERAYA